MYISAIQLNCVQSDVREMSMDNNASVTPPWFLKSSLVLEEIRPQSNIIGYFRTLPHHRLRERFVHPTIHHELNQG